MKLAAIYTLFNGTECLHRSIKQILPYVDIIILGIQEVSNSGNQIKEQDRSRIFNAHREFDKSIIVNYTPSMSYDRKENERRKLQFMLDTAKELGASHWLLLAGDHIYKPKELKAAKDKISKGQITADVTLSEMFTYYKKPTWQLSEIESYYMPFICKLKKDTKVVKENKYPYRVDPSVRINADTFHLFGKELMLHHFSMVRNSVEWKIKNAAAGQGWTKEKAEKFIKEWNNYDIELNPGVEYFGGKKIRIVEDYFKLNAIFVYSR